MKKTYITPAVKLYIAIEENMIASSPSYYRDGGTVGSGEELGREDNSISSSSIWDQGW